MWTGLLVVALASVVAAGCPRRCECQLTEVHCSRTQATEFPEPLDSDTTFLDVGHNKIVSIRNNTFLHLGVVHLVVLVADHNNIAVVEQDAFAGLEELEKVNLSGNLIQNIYSLLFQNSPNMKHFELTGNPVYLPTEGPLLVAPKMEWLELDYCNITQFPGEALKQMPVIRYLNINNNALNSLELQQIKKLSYLRYLKLQNNPLDCSCTNHALWKWCSLNNIKVEGTCSSPQKVSGLPVANITQMGC